MTKPETAQFIADHDGNCSHQAIDCYKCPAFPLSKSAPCELATDNEKYWFMKGWLEHDKA